MTLLIGTMSKKHIVITTDGLSRVNPITGAGEASNSYQKVFPIQGLPVAFAHHGLNILAGKPVKNFIEDYITAYGTQISKVNIKEIAETLRCYASQHAEIAVNEPTNTGGVGFWIAGFGSGRQSPEWYEIFWPNAPTPRRLGSIVFGGDGQDFIQAYLNEPLGPFNPGNVGSYSLMFMEKYHQRLYEMAEAKQNKAGQVIFGGYQHQLVLKKTGWIWTKPPK